MKRPALKNEEIAIHTSGLTRRFDRTVAVDHLNIEIGRGDICGFIGPNGAGKTTTLLMLSTLLDPSSGSAHVFGYDIRKEQDPIRRLIGYMPDQFGLYRDMVAGEYLDFFAAAYGISLEERKQIVRDVLALTDLTAKASTPITALSRGMQQRLSLARVLVHDPELLLLDEPASGLDPRARIEIRALLAELSAMNKTIFISSHILTELAELCNRVVIIEQGKVLFTGTMAELEKQTAPFRTVRIEVKGEAEPAWAILKDLPRVRSAECNNGLITVTLQAEEEDGSFLADVLIGNGFSILSFTPGKAQLEEAFMNITRGKVS